MLYTPTPVRGLKLLRTDDAVDEILAIHPHPRKGTETLETFFCHQLHLYNPHPAMNNANIRNS